MSGGALWVSRKFVDGAWLEKTLPAPLKEETDAMVKLATFQPASKQLIALNVNRTAKPNDAVQTLVCGAFFRRSDEPDGAFNVTRVAVEIEGDLVDGPEHSGDDTQFSWKVCLARKCSAAKKLTVHSNSTTVELDALPDADEALSAIQFKLEVTATPDVRSFVLKRLVLTLEYDVEPLPPASTKPAGGDDDGTVAFYAASLADWSMLSIVAIVITSFFCGIVCTGVVWSICRRGKKPIAYDKA